MLLFVIGGHASLSCGFHADYSAGPPVSTQHATRLVFDAVNGWAPSGLSHVRREADNASRSHSRSALVEPQLGQATGWRVQKIKTENAQFVFLSWSWNIHDAWRKPHCSVREKFVDMEVHLCQNTGVWVVQWTGGRFAERGSDTKWEWLWQRVALLYRMRC
jgi:hypothetical protein